MAANLPNKMLSNVRIAFEKCKAEMDPYDFCTTQEFKWNIQKKIETSYDVALNQMKPNRKSGRNAMSNLLTVQFLSMNFLYLNEYDEMVLSSEEYELELPLAERMFLKDAFEICKIEMDPCNLCIMKEFKLKFQEKCFESYDIALNLMFPNQKKARDALSKLLKTQFSLIDIATEPAEKDKNEAPPSKVPRMSTVDPVFQRSTSRQSHKFIPTAPNVMITIDDDLVL